MKKAISSYGKYALIVGILMIAIIVFLQTNNNNIKDKNKTVETKNTESNVKTETTATVPQENNEVEKAPGIDNTQTTAAIDQITKDKIDDLINTYYTSLQEVEKDILDTTKEEEGDEKLETIILKRSGIEIYKNIKSYIRAGVEVDSYVVFSTYDLKFYNIDTLAPGMSVLNVIKQTNGNFAINIEPIDETLSAYIEQLYVEKEIKDIMDEVDAKLISAIKKDEALGDLVEKLEKGSVE